MPRRKPASRTSMARKRARLPELHAEGLSVRQIAEKLGIARSTVSKWGKLDGLLFDRSQTKAATEAITADLARRRAENASRFMDRLEWALTQMSQPGYRVAGNGALVRLPEPDGRDVQAWMTAAGIATQRSLELARFDADAGDASSIDKFLDHLAGK